MHTLRRKAPKLTLGHTVAWLFSRVPVRLFPVKLAGRELDKHKHIMGVTGSGKSQFLIQMIVQLVMQGTPCTVIDPHGDLVHDCLALLYDHGHFTDKDGFATVLYVDFTRNDAFVPCNILNQPYPPHTTALNVVEAFKRAYPELAEAPLFTQIMLSCLMVLIAHNLPLTRLPDILTQDDYRHELLQKEGLDPVVVDYFKNEFASYGRETATNIGSTLRRAFLTQFTPALRFALGQTDNILDFQKLMQEQKTVLINLGGLDHETKRLIGCFLSVMIEQATLSRADMREEERSACHVFIDECQIFLSKSEEAFTSLLSEARKYKVSLWLSHQNISQLSERMLGAFQNALPICFQLLHPDSQWGSRIFGRYNPSQIRYSQTTDEQTAFESVQGQFELMAQLIEELEPGEAYIKLKNRFGQRGSRTIRFRTRQIRPVRQKSEKIIFVREHYKTALLRPLEQIVALEQIKIRRKHAPTVGRKGYVSLPSTHGKSSTPLPKQKSAVKPLETSFKGYRFRSRTEARWAVFFDHLALGFEYEKQGYDLSGIWYLPDFWIPHLDCFIEIKGEDPTQEEQQRAWLLAQSSGKAVYIFSGSLPLPEDNRVSKDMQESNSAYRYVWDPITRRVIVDAPHWWCECQSCGSVGISRRGNSQTLSCACPKQENTVVTTIGTPRLLAAYTAARSARF